MRKKSVWLFVAAAVLVTSLAVSQAAVAKSDKALAGTVVFGHDQEPATLNNVITPGNAATSSYVTNLVLEQGQIYNEKAVLVPRLMDGKPKIVKTDPFTVAFRYKATANWSDGTPVTGNDFKARYDAIMNPNWDIISRTGYEDIASSTRGLQDSVEFANTITGAVDVAVEVDVAGDVLSCDAGERKVVGNNVGDDVAGNVLGV